MLIGLAVVENNNHERGAEKLMKLLSDSAIFLARVLSTYPAVGLFSKAT